MDEPGRIQETKNTSLRNTFWNNTAQHILFCHRVRKKHQRRRLHWRNNHTRHTIIQERKLKTKRFLWMFFVVV